MRRSALLALGVLALACVWGTARADNSEYFAGSALNDGFDADGGDSVGVLFKNLA